MAENYFILQGGAELLDWFRKYAKWIGTTQQFFWTCPKTAKKGDKAFIYLCAPESRIVASVDLVAEPFQNVGNMFENKIMQDKWCVEIGSAVYFEPRRNLAMKGLRELFAVDWPWLRYPRGNTKIPADLIEPFLELINQK
ncbi:MAG: hypothetical protein JSS81_07320 [Acidobacteria bacterium]|nr:hypothetical protein [Acidobacteriota bacterium]